VLEGHAKDGEYQLMKWRVVAALAALAACKPVATTGSLTNEVIDVATDGGVGPNLPPAGRSLFDHLVTVREDGEQHLRVPYPLPKLIDLINSKTTKPVVPALLPKGRSLQRLAANPDFFKHPRVVVGVVGDPKQTDADLGLYMRNQLFLGHVDTTDVLEVISYNPEAGRFEFQIVEDYKAGGTPRVTYARRALCVSCHQNQGPIFPVFPWDETNGDPDVSALIKAEHPNSATYLGQPIVQSRQVPYRLDNATDKANLLPAYRKLWVDGCGGNAAGGVRCRGDVLAMALDFALTGSFDVEGDQYKRLQNAWQTYWAAAMPDGIKIRSADLKNRDPLAAATGAGGTTNVNLSGAISDADRELLERLAADAALEPEFEPLTPRPDAIDTWEFDVGGDTNRIIFGIAEFFTDLDRKLIKKHMAGDFGKVRTAIDALVAQGQAGDHDLLAAKGFRREATLQALVAELGMMPLPAACCDTTGLPAPVVSGSSEPSEEDLSPTMRHFVKYCGDCHIAGQISFLKGDSDAEKWARLKPLAQDIYDRLDWESLDPTETSPMPPIATEQNILLGQDPVARKAMSAAARAILDGEEVP
jgi:hypothetical protein